LSNSRTLPAPAPNDELWRFASVGRLKIDDFAPAGSPAAASTEALLDRSSLVSERAGRQRLASMTIPFPLRESARNSKRRESSISPLKLPSNRILN
jgi:hypothetical protein